MKARLRKTPSTVVHVKEALPIINKELLEGYKKLILTKYNLKSHIETTLSALKLIREAMNLAKEKDEKLSDNIGALWF